MMLRGFFMGGAHKDNFKDVPPTVEQEPKAKPGLHKSKMRWESDLNITINEQLWPDLCQNSLYTIINAQYRLMNFNIRCFRCGIEVDCFLHCTWLCTEAKRFWHDMLHFNPNHCSWSSSQPWLVSVGKLHKYLWLAKQKAAQIYGNCSMCSQEIHHGVLEIWLCPCYS